MLLLFLSYFPLLLSWSDFSGRVSQLTDFPSASVLLLSSPVCFLFWLSYFFSSKIFIWFFFVIVYFFAETFFFTEYMSSFVLSMQLFVKHFHRGGFEILVR